MKRRTKWGARGRVAAVVAVGVAAGAAVGLGPAEAHRKHHQPVLSSRSAPIITVDRLRFRDLDRNGALTPYTGASGIAGEVGHIAVEPWGPLCRCGNRGCLETLATTTAIARHVGPVDGADLPWPSLVALARDGDRATLDAVRHAGTVVGQVLAGLCTAVDPGIVVVGGDLGGCRAFLDAARSTMRSGALRPHGLDLVPAVLGDRAELLGAIDIALDAPSVRT